MLCSGHTARLTASEQRYSISGHGTLCELNVSVPRTAGIQANKAAGDAVRDLIATREAPALIEQTFRTVGGVRRVDVLKLGDELAAIESKVGRTGLGLRGSRIRQELARDWWLQRQGQVDPRHLGVYPERSDGAGWSGRAAAGEAQQAWFRG